MDKIIQTSTIKQDLKSADKPQEESVGFFKSYLESFFTEVTLISRFAIRFFKQVFLPPYEFSEVIRQSFIIGYKSLGLIAITGFIMGLVLTIQTIPTMAEFGAQSWVPSMVAVSVIREIGPAITALICAGKIGSGIGAELASMKVTEQIDAMEVSAINPFKYIVVTRVLATTIMVPLLVIFSDAVSLLGSYAGVNIKGDTSFLLFFNQVFGVLTFSDLIPAFIKTFFFGFAIGLIPCYKGYNSNNGTQGVGEAANSSVVMASLLIFVIDMLAVQITDLFVNS
ncbi:MAG: ABC transporter permease [Bacteroidia bacterium]|nr:ABC transporter permease [Bacteroidia bacterium]